MLTKTRLGSRVKAMMAKHIVTELNLSEYEEEFDQDEDSRWIKIEQSFDIPEYPGWKFVGIGTTRVCLMHDGIVYKVDIVDALANNCNEYNNYQKIISKTNDGWIGESFRVAECELYQINRRSECINVLAMEYVNGEHATPDESADIDYLIDNEFGITDTYSGNVRYDSDGVLVLIDYSR
jgi:hypothetical protein